jgi:hypothetical protein
LDIEPSVFGEPHLSHTAGGKWPYQFDAAGYPASGSKVGRNGTSWAARRIGARKEANILFRLQGYSHRNATV